MDSPIKEGAKKKILFHNGPLPVEHYLFRDKSDPNSVSLLKSYLSARLEIPVWYGAHQVAYLNVVMGGGERDGIVLGFEILFL